MTAHRLVVRLRILAGAALVLAPVFFAFYSIATVSLGVLGS